MQSFGLPGGSPAPISATILNGFAGRTKQKEWAENPLFSFATILPRAPNRRVAAPTVTELLRKIEAAPSFVFIVSPGAFDRCRDENDWVRREIGHALKRVKNIVPLLMEGCKMPESQALPEEIADLVRYNGVEYSNKYADAAIKELARMVSI